MEPPNLPRPPYFTLRAACGLAAFLIALMLGGAPAFADDRPNPQAKAQAGGKPEQAGALPQGVGVLDRARLEYDASGLPVGSFVLYPSLAGGISIDDNVFRTAGGAVSDEYWITSPRLDLRSQWAHDRLQLYAQLDDYRYAAKDSESRTNWFTGGSSDLFLGGDTTLDINATFMGTHESRTSPDISTQALSPTAYRQIHADTALTYQPGPVGLSAGVSLDRYDYDPTSLRGGGLLDNADRNADVFEVFGKASYDFLAGSSLFARASYNVHDFDQMLDRNGLDHASHGYRVDTGLQAMFTPLVKGTIFVGYLEQDFRAPLSNVSGIDFGSELDWYVTELVTLHLSTARVLTNTTLAGASSEDERTIRGSFDYELLRNVILQGNLGYENDIFDGISRRDHIVTAGFEAKYLLNQRMSLYAGFSHADRNSNSSSGNFSDNLGTAGIRFQY